jgi:hyperosmotically inducible periplasmic protein
MTFSTRSFAGFIAAALLAVLVGCAGAGTKTGQAIDDATITTKVKAQMANDKDVSAMDVHVNTEKGVVRLSGVVKSSAEKQRAEQVARAVDGVRSVDNVLVVRSSPQ